MDKNLKNVGDRIILTLTMFFVLVLVTVFPVKAADKPSPITALQQEGATSSSVKVSWSCLGGSDLRYKVEIADQPSGNYVTVEEKRYSSPIWIYDLAPGREYYVRVTSYTNGGGYGDTSSPIKVVTAPGKATEKITHAKSTTNTISLNWSEVQGADIYRIKYKATYGNEMVCETANTNITLKNLAKDEEYRVKILAGKKYADGVTIAWSGNEKTIYNIPVKPSKATGVRVNYYWQNLSEISVENSKIGCADGYQYQLYTAYKDKDSKIKTVTTSSSSAQTYIKASALKKYNFYKVRVRAYALNSKNEKMYGGWSSWKYVSPQPDVTKIKNNKSKKGIQISWDKIKGANRYVVYVSTKKASGYKKFQTTTKTGTVITKYGKNKLKSGKTYYFYVVPQKKVGNKYVSGLADNANYCWSLKYKK